MIKVFVCPNCKGETPLIEKYKTEYIYIEGLHYKSVFDCPICNSTITGIYVSEDGEEMWQVESIIQKKEQESVSHELGAD